MPFHLNVNKQGEGKSFSAAALNKERWGLESGAKLKVQAPLELEDSSGGPVLKLSDDGGFWARLSGTANPYTYLEVHEDTGGVWTDGERSGTAYEANGATNLNNRIVFTYPGVNRDVRRFQKDLPPCTSKLTIGSHWYGPSGSAYPSLAWSLHDWSPSFGAGSLYASGTTDGTTGLSVLAGIDAPPEYCVQFDGSSMYLDCAADAGFSMASGGNLAISCFLKPTSLDVPSTFGNNNATQGLVYVTVSDCTGNGLSSSTVQLYKGGSLYASGTTDSSGFHQFSSVPYNDGSVFYVVATSGSLTATTSNFTLSGVADVAVKLGPTSTMTTSVSPDGIIDVTVKDCSGNGLSSATVQLFMNGSLYASGTTDTHGFYEFSSIPFNDGSTFYVEATSGALTATTSNFNLVDKVSWSMRLGSLWTISYEPVNPSYGVIDVVVKDCSSVIISGASVVLTRSGSTYMTLLTDSSGTCQFVGVPYDDGASLTVSATSGSYTTTSSSFNLTAYETATLSVGATCSTATLVSYGGNQRGIMFKGSEYGIYLKNRHITLGVNDGGTWREVSSGETVHAGQWLAVGMSYQHSNKKAYLVISGISTLSLTLANDIAATASNFELGRGKDDTLTYRYFDGSIDQLAFGQPSDGNLSKFISATVNFTSNYYDFTPNNIANVYALTHYYEFSEASGTDKADSRGTATLVDHNTCVRAAGAVVRATRVFHFVSTPAGRPPINTQYRFRICSSSTLCCAVGPLTSTETATVTVQWDQTQHDVYWPLAPLCCTTDQAAIFTSSFSLAYLGTLTDPAGSPTNVHVWRSSCQHTSISSFTDSYGYYHCSASGPVLAYSCSSVGCLGDYAVEGRWRGGDTTLYTTAERGDSPGGWIENCGCTAGLSYVTRFVVDATFCAANLQVASTSDDAEGLSAFNVMPQVLSPMFLSKKLTGNCSHLGYASRTLGPITIQVNE